MEKPVLIEIIENTALISLNRPEKRNAINRGLLMNLFDCIDEASGNDKVKAVIITGKGKSFCAGLDLEAIKTENLLDPRKDGRDLPDIFRDCKKPILGAVNGHAITGGFEIALNCDFLIASESASFRDTHARIGIHPGWGMTQLLQESVGIRRAKELSFTCRAVSAEEALRIGLVNQVVPDGDLVKRALEIAAEIAMGNGEILPRMKELINFRKGASHDAAFANERRRFRDFYAGLLEKLK